LLGGTDWADEKRNSVKTPHLLHPPSPSSAWSVPPNKYIEHSSTLFFLHLSAPDAVRNFVIHFRKTWKEAPMKPRRLLVLSTLLIALSSAIANAQSPVNQPARGKNGSTAERTADNIRQETGKPQKPAQPALQPSVDIRPVSNEPVRAGENIRLNVDLVVLDAQVLQQKTGRVAGNLKKEDFLLAENGVRQQITHFSQDTLPLSVILLIDRGGCLDPFSSKVKQATLEALSRLRPQDEVALMSFANTTELIEGFGHGNDRILAGLDHLPPHDENADHCFNTAFYDAANYMRRAGNPDGRRVIIMITGMTIYFNCGGPSAEDARMAVLESGSVVCGIIPKTVGQRMENGVMIAAAGIGGLFKAKTSSLKQLADETGGEVLTDKPENLDHTFNDLIDHLRTRYTLGFVSTNKKRDGTFRKLKLELANPPAKTEERLVIKTKRGYIAARDSGHQTNDRSRENDHKF
jgi:VWFA-related protein